MLHSLVEAVIAFVLVILALAVGLRPFREKGRTAPPPTDLDLASNRIGPTVFLFHGGKLRDATAPARMLLSRLPSRDLTGLLIWLEQRLPGASDTLRIARDEGRAEVAGPVGHGSARLRLVADSMGGDIMRLTLIDPEAEGAGILVDTLSQRALEEEAALLRTAMDGAPILVWRQDDDGAITWANQAYIAAAEARSAAEDISLWPLPRVLDIASLPDGAAPEVARHELAGRDGGHWFDCHSRRIGAETIIFALPADAAVRAERSLREFVQTLTKTFADLPIGLAIFDRARNLQLFNPALIDLTNLSAGMLIGRPSLHAFLDQLRENRIIPEPRDYRSWRRQIATLEAAAAEGHHVETWSLPGGQTYRVTGRPHPDGAIAFLFEDISAEITLTRRFRADIQLGTNTLDALGDAVAVFGGDGQPVLTNALWRHVWGDKATLGALGDAVAARLGEAPAGLTRLHQHITGTTMREPAQGSLALASGQILQWRSAPMPAGRILLTFAGDGLEDATAPGVPAAGTADQPADKAVQPGGATAPANRIASSTSS